MAPCGYMASTATSKQRPSSEIATRPAPSFTSVSPYATQVLVPGSTIVHGAIARPLARAATLLGSYDQAEEWFGIAHDIHTRLEAPFFIALGQLDRADLCLARRYDGISIEGEIWWRVLPPRLPVRLRSAHKTGRGTPRRLLSPVQTRPLSPNTGSVMPRFPATTGSSSLRLSSTGSRCRLPARSLLAARLSSR